MADELWEKIITDKDVKKRKTERKKAMLYQKILASDLPSYVDEGWEKSKDFKSPKYVGVSQQKSVSLLFEDRVWVLLADMCFDEMNTDHDFYVPYDFQNPENTERIDVFAADDETVLVVKCFSSDTETEFSFAEIIKDFNNKISGIRKTILKKYPGRKVKFVFAMHNYIMNRRDLALMDKMGIELFDDATVTYYEELAKHLGSSSRYQLLGKLFANQEIKNMDDRVPAIQGKMGGYTYYSFSIEPEKLLKIGYVLHRSDSNANKDNSSSYQRIIKKSRLKQVRSFIENGGYFPNSIIISIDTNKKGLVFEKSSLQADNTISKIGILRIPKRYRSAYIIDGQHRLYGYSDSKYASTNTIPVVAFVDLAREEQIKLFMDINENQKAVPKSLRVTLNADLLWDSDDCNEQRQALRSKIAQMLGERSTSPLFQRVVIGESEVTPEKCITVEAIQSALKKCHFFNTYNKNNTITSEGTFDCAINQETCDLFYPFLERCLLYIRKNCLDEWNKGDRDNGMLTMNRGIQAVIRIVDDLVNMLVEKQVIDPKHQDIEDMFAVFPYYLKPFVDYINKLTADQRKDLRGYFGSSSDTRFWRAYQKSIADVRKDFVPDGLDEYWQNESKIYNEETKTMLNEVENKVKEIIETRLSEYFGESWLIKGLPRAVYTRVKSEADKTRYNMVSNDEDDIDIPVYKFVNMSDCKQIVLNNGNWKLFFEDAFIRPEEEKLSGGRDAKTDWMVKINTIQNKLQKESYSVSVDEYTYVKSIYDWLKGMLAIE